MGMINKHKIHCVGKM